MVSTPTRTPTGRGRSNPSPSPKASPGPCPYKGIAITVPGKIFKVPDTNYTAVVNGWNGRRTDSVTVTFDDDDSQYWFPLEDVLKWMQRNPADAEPPMPFSTEQPEASPASSNKSTGLRRRNRSATAASSREQGPAGEVDAAADDGADLLQEDQQEQLQQQRRRQQTTAEQQQCWLSYRTLGLLCGLALLLLATLAALNADKGAAPVLDGWKDNMHDLYANMKAKFAGMSSAWDRHQPQDAFSDVHRKPASNKMADLGSKPATQGVADVSAGHLSEVVITTVAVAEEVVVPVQQVQPDSSA